MLRTIIVVAAIAAVMNASVAFPFNRVVKEVHNGVPNDWSIVGATPRQVNIELIFAVKQQNLDILEKTLLEVSNPDSPSYGKHLSPLEVQQLVAPPQHSVDIVMTWLAEHGVTMAQNMTITPNADFIAVQVPVSVAERLLHVQYFEYVHVGGQHRVHRAITNYTLPAHIAPHIDFVGPTIRFPRVQRTSMPLPSSPTMRRPLQFGGVTPKVLRQLYNVGTYENQSPNNLQAVAQFLEQYYSPSDLQSFFKQFYPTAIGRVVSKVVGPNKEGNPGIEASLDIEYIMALGGNVTTEFWSTAGRAPDNPENEPFLKWLMNLASTSDAPHVFSVSYGDNEDSVTYDYASRINTEFQKAGARGISIMFSSGDGGVAGGQSSQCTKFIPTFPAGSPWVTAVGGTTGSSPETAASLSSGGFSNYWDRPSYQDNFVSQYFKVAKNLPDSSLYNHTGAGIPDVAAQAQGFNVVYSGFPMPVDGTSCSSPTFAGIVSLLNAKRFQAGKSPLGYLNPLFYKNADAFNDVTSGNNPGCGTNGFEAAPGWDPVTGLGTPDFEKLSKIVLSLQ